MTYSACSPAFCQLQWWVGLVHQRSQEPVASSVCAYSTSRLPSQRICKVLWGRLLDWLAVPIHCFASLLGGASESLLDWCVAATGLSAALGDRLRLCGVCWHSVASVRCFPSTGRVVRGNERRLDHTCRTCTYRCLHVDA